MFDVDLPFHQQKKNDLGQNTADGCEILQQLIDGKHPIILLGFQPSFWWCRISQPSTVCQTIKVSHGNLT